MFDKSYSQSGENMTSTPLEKLRQSYQDIEDKRKQSLRLLRKPTLIIGFQYGPMIFQILVNLF